MQPKLMRSGVLRVFALSCALLAVAFSPGCRHKSSGTPGAGTGPVLLSPSSVSATVATNVLSLEFAADKYVSATCVNVAANVSYVGIVDGTTLFIHGVELIPGANELRVDATRADGSRGQTILNLVQAAGPGYVVTFTASPERGDSTPLEVQFAINHNLSAAPTEVLIDATRDGAFEVKQPFAATVNASFATTGTFKPRVLIRTSDNVLITMADEHAPTVRVLPGVTIDPGLAFPGAGNQITDLAFNPATNQLFVLATGDGVVRVFDEQRNVVRTINLPGLTQPAGMGLDGDANLYVVGSSNSRVLKLLAPNYNPDTLVGPGGLFGSAGSADGQFQAPTDVAAEGKGDQVRIFVADTGNDRVQRFNRAGVHELTITQVPGGGAIGTPRGIASLPAGGFVILEDTLARFLSSNGEFIGQFGQLQNAGRITRNWHTGGFVVTSNGNLVQQFSTGGTLRQTSTIAGGVDVATVVPSTQGGQLVIAKSGSNELQVGMISQDPESATPVAIVTAFLQALAASDSAAARVMIADSAVESFDAAVADTTIWSRVVAQSSTVTNLVLLQEDDVTACVSGDRPEGTATVAVEFVLTRDSETGRWTIQNF
tara:strand:- start:6920 stop:8719 length:1800 start_codon:yes stop_codon:yes gene_type:complete